MRERYSEVAFIGVAENAGSCLLLRVEAGNYGYSALIFRAGYTACPIGSALKIAEHGVEKSGEPRVDVRLAKGGYEAYRPLCAAQ